MGVIRTAGLIFVMTILIGGCMAALSVSPPTPPPIAKSPREVPWEVAVAMLHRGVVVSVAQTHSLRVYLLLKDGSRVITVEPELDAIFVELEACGPICRGVQAATE